MKTRRAPRPVDDQPARWVTDLWRQWIDPVAAAFDELAVADALGDVRRRIHGASQAPDDPGKSEGVAPG